eukprot:10188366-Heterocapsa_arctica.AAC.1
MSSCLASWLAGMAVVKKTGIVCCFVKIPIGAFVKVLGRVSVNMAGYRSPVILNHLVLVSSWGPGLEQT